MKTITAGELLEVVDDIIAQYGEGKLVAFASDYGDHSHTQQLHSLVGDIEEVAYRKTAYSVSGYAIAGDDESSAAVDPIDDDTIIVLS